MLQGLLGGALGLVLHEAVPQRLPVRGSGDRGGRDDSEEAEGGLEALAVDSVVEIVDLDREWGSQ